MRRDEQLSALQALDRKAPEQVANLRKVTAGWHPDDARWDALVAAIDWACRDHAHELAEKIRRELPERVKKLTGNWAEIRTVSTAQHAADLIDPKKEGQ